MGEPPLFLSASVFYAIKDAIYSARKDSGLTEPFRLDSPATPERIRNACVDIFTKMVIASGSIVCFLPHMMECVCCSQWPRPGIRARSEAVALCLNRWGSFHGCYSSFHMPPNERPIHRPALLEFLLKERLLYSIMKLQFIPQSSKCCL